MTTLKKDLFKKKNQLSREVRVVSPYPITHQFKVDPMFIGATILDLMSSKFPFQSATEWKRRIEMGRVYANGKDTFSEFILSANDQIFHFNPRVIEPTVPDEVEVLAETADYLIVYKPAPLPMHPGGRYYKNTLVEILKEKGFEEPRIIHRLDAVTSGLVLIGRNKEFAKYAVQCFTEGEVAKTYFAEVEGIPKEKRITVSASIRRKNGFVFECGEDLAESKNATTHFEVVEARENTSLIKCTPETGRTHQIRLHLSHWGHPIIDDTIYGRYGDISSRKAQNKGISLISSGLEIEKLGISYRLDF